MYVVIEGPDKVGKSSLFSGLEDAFPDAMFVKEPGSAQIAWCEQLKQLMYSTPAELRTPEVMQLGMLTCRLAQFKALDTIGSSPKDNLVVSDRSWISSAVYYMRDAGFQEASACFDSKTSLAHFVRLTQNLIQSGKIWTPDLILLLECSLDSYEERFFKADDRNILDNAMVMEHAWMTEAYYELLINLPHLFFGPTNTHIQLINTDRPKKKVLTDVIKAIRMWL